jgi:hypothetical protein
MSGEERRESQRRDFARPTEAQREAAAPACGLEDRIEATRRVLQWLDHEAFKIESQAPPSRRCNGHSGDTPTDPVV